jgi:hypothetical protein
MNYFEIIKQTWIRKSGEVIADWSSVDSDDQSKVMLEINECLRDFWLNYSYLFKSRQATMQTAVNQQAYTLPFDGELADKGVWIKELSGNPLNNYRKLQYLADAGQFYAQERYGNPRYYTIYDSKLLLFEIPDNVYDLNLFYDSDLWAVSVDSVKTNADISANQIAVNNASVFKAGGVYIDRGTASEEYVTISTPDLNTNTLNILNPLTKAHNAGARIEQEKQILEYETDEPNFKSEFHNVISYYVLTRLFYNDPARYQIYNKAFTDALSMIIVRSELTSSAGAKLTFTDSDYSGYNYNMNLNGFY